MHGALFLFSVFGFKTVVLFFVVLGRLSGRMQELVSRMCPVSRNRAAVLCLVFALLWSCVSSNRADVLCLVISRANLRKRLRGWPGAPPVSDKETVSGHAREGGVFAWSVCCRLLCRCVYMTTWTIWGGAYKKKRNPRRTRLQLQMTAWSSCPPAVAHNNIKSHAEKFGNLQKQTNDQLRKYRGGLPIRCGPIRQHQGLTKPWS